MGTVGGPTRLGTGSPSHELGRRLSSKRYVVLDHARTLDADKVVRAREIQAQEGLTPSVWGPPASGGSTPLRETIPESPNQDGFPDLVPPLSISTTGSLRSRARAGTVPSRFPPGLASGASTPSSIQQKSGRPTPSPSPYRSPSLLGMDLKDPKNLTSSSQSALLSRLRAGSLPQSTNQLDRSNPFSTSPWSNGWGSGRSRATTLASIKSSEGPDSPAQSTFSKDGMIDGDVKTLDYLGLAETPQQSQSTTVQPVGTLSNSLLSSLSAFRQNPNRFRSYSVNAKEKYADEDEEDYGDASDSLTAYALTQQQIHQHNLAVQAFAAQASASRPRARTAGVLDAPMRLSSQGFLGNTGFDQRLGTADLGMASGIDYAGLPEAVRAMQLNSVGNRAGYDTGDENTQEIPTRALWLGNIPMSTTMSSVEAIFEKFGKIESTRVLVHKNCGFVNFDAVESAITARTALNGKELFPGAGPVKIGYAKAPSGSMSGTPGVSGGLRSRSPELSGDVQAPNKVASQSFQDVQNGAQNGLHPPVPEMRSLREMRSELLEMVMEFGATEHDKLNIAQSIDAAIDFDGFESEVPAVQEPSQTRIFDAPKLRDIRKRIDNNTITQVEIEDTAMQMLPEIAELASDYLGNTVVQKLFEFCSEEVKDHMLMQVDPHLAEIGVHKNGTWAAQKVIDTAKTSNQMKLIADSLHPFTVPLFLDQYGNYVLQCCLRFGFPANNFIFETMLSKLWSVAQGRFGARAMRACLESHHATKDQQRMLASTIALHCVQLATNTNAALLLTWYLDTCTLPKRRAVLAPRLIPHLAHLCTHKVAYLTVLKVINQRNEPDAREAVLRALFFSENDTVLEEILADQACGSTLIYKILTTPFLDENLRNDVVTNIKNVLMKLKVSPSQGYKRLMDEVGMSGRMAKGERENHHINGHGHNYERSRPSSQHSMSGRKHHHIQQQPNQYQPQMQHTQVPYTLPLNASISAAAPFDQYDPSLQNLQMSPLNQQSMLGGQARGTSPASFYGNVTPGFATQSPALNQNGFPGGFTPQTPQRPMHMTANGVMGQSPFITPQGVTPMMGNGQPNGFQYSPVQYLPQQQGVMGGQMMGVPDGRRYGRVSCSLTNLQPLSND